MLKLQTKFQVVPTHRVLHYMDFKTWKKLCYKQNSCNPDCFFYIWLSFSCFQVVKIMHLKLFLFQMIKFSLEWHYFDLNPHSVIWWLLMITWEQENESQRRKEPQILHLNQHKNPPLIGTSVKYGINFCKYWNSTISTNMVSNNAIFFSNAQGPLCSLSLYISLVLA